MKKIISCCGANCLECEYYPEQCEGCPDIKGKKKWMKYTGEPICNINNCCIEQKKNEHCGKCSLLRLDTEPSKNEEK